jgi:hypothetical protein
MADDPPENTEAPDEPLGPTLEAVSEYPPEAVGGWYIRELDMSTLIPTP